MPQGVMIISQYMSPQIVIAVDINEIIPFFSFYIICYAISEIHEIEFFLSPFLVLIRSLIMKFVY